MELDVSSTKTAFRGIKNSLLQIFTTLEGAGNILPRIRYANDLSEWLQIAAIVKVNQVQVVRCVFIYLQGWPSPIRAEARSTLLQPIYGIEIIQGFEDGTDEDNSTLVFEDFCADAIDHFIRDLYLGFTEGAEVTHTGLSGDGGDGRPQYVDGILAHRKLCTLQANFKLPC